MFIDDEGVYTPATIGKSLKHYVPTIHAAFVFEPILDLEEDLGFKILKKIPQGSKVHRIVIMDGANKLGVRETFSPKEITLQEGDVVEWTSKEKISAHVLMSGSHSNWKSMGKTFISPMIKPEGVFRWQFNTFGEFRYCSATYKHVEGKIIVKHVTVIPPPGKAAISIAIKMTKKLTLLAVKNNDEFPIYGLELKSTNGGIRHVKARAKGWGRRRVDPNTVIIQTDDEPITKGRRLIVLLLPSGKIADLEWKAFDSGNNNIATGVLPAE